MSTRFLSHVGLPYIPPCVPYWMDGACVHDLPQADCMECQSSFLPQGDAKATISHWSNSWPHEIILRCKTECGGWM